MITSRNFKAGEPVVFQVCKRSVNPGPRAKGVTPEPRGEGYVYHVDKYWVVDRVESDGRVVLRTRRGKIHVVHADNPQLRRPGLIERWMRSHRFPQTDDSDSGKGPRRASA